MPAPFFMRPRVLATEIDLTVSARADVSSFGFINGEFKRGPLKPTYTGGLVENFRKLYGVAADPTISFAHDTATVFMSESSNLLVNRVVNGATYGGTDIFIDEDVVYGNRFIFNPFAIGSATAYDAGGAASTGLTALKVSGSVSTRNFVLANSISTSITDGSTVVPITVVFTTNHEQTMTALANAIQTALNTFGQGGVATVLKETSSVNAPSYTILIKAPATTTLQFNPVVVTGGVTQPTVTFVTAATGWFATVMAENPGDWSNDIGIKVTSFDKGIRERFRITFSGPLITGNSYSVAVNNTNVGPVAFSVDSDTTMLAIANALKLNANVGNAYVETVAGTVNNDRSIIVEAKTPGQSKLFLTSSQVTAGASQAATTIDQTLTGSDSTGSFVLEVFERAAPFFPLERFEITTFPQLNGRGEQIQYVGKVNSDSVGSYNVRMVVNPAFITKTGFTATRDKLIADSFDTGSLIRYLGGGLAGSKALTSQLINGVDSIKDRTRYPVSMLLNAGYTQVAYQKKLVKMAQDRNDCFAILDIPSDRQGTALSARDYRLYDLDIDSSHGGIYTPDVKIVDLTSGDERFIPPSGVVGAAFVYTDKVANKWSAPAGVNRGKLRLVQDLRYHYSPEDEELLFPNGVNYILDKPAYGPVIWTQETLQRKKSALSSVHIRRLLSMLTTSITDSLDIIFHENNNDNSRFIATQLAESIVSPVYRAEGLYDYRIKCDEENNTADIIDADALAMAVYLKPQRSIKGVLLNMVLTRSGANFEEIENVLF
jgi:hypothetical protein